MTLEKPLSQEPDSIAERSVLIVGDNISRQTAYDNLFEAYEINHQIVSSADEAIKAIDEGQITDVITEDFPGWIEVVVSAIMEGLPVQVLTTRPEVMEAAKMLRIPCHDKVYAQDKVINDPRKQARE